MKLIRYPTIEAQPSALFHSDAYATRGYLTADDGTVLVAATLEPAPPDLPPGSYPCKRYRSPHFGYDVFRLYDVPGHEAIEIHKGNLPADTHGCILVGSSFGDLWVHDPGEPERTALGILGSKVAFDAFMERLQAVDAFTLTVAPIPEES